MTIQNLVRLAGIGAVSLTFAAYGAPVLWTCQPDPEYGEHGFNYEIDDGARTFDGTNASFDGPVVILRQHFTAQTLTTILNRQTGRFSIDGTSGGALSRGLCIAKSTGDSAVPNSGQIASVGTNETKTSTPQETRSEQPPAAPDPRAAELKNTYVALLQQARSGKMKYLSAARQYREKFEALYPEESGNVLLNEYLAYMAVVGEKVDRKKLTDAEAEYELAKKVSELQGRAQAMQALSASKQETATRKASDDAAVRKASEETAARKRSEEAAAEREREIATARLSIEERRLAYEQELADRQLAEAEKRRRAEAAAAMMQTGIDLLFPRRNQQVCTGQWFAGRWVQTCN